jgi:hypothetical protein
MTPWPDDVFDCALRLARSLSLGYRLIDVLFKDGRVYVNYPTWSEKWRELDLRNPTVWGALIGPDGVKELVYKAPEFATVIYDGAKRDTPVLPASYSATCGDGLKGTHKDIGIAVCEAYNALKGNPRWVND